MGTSLVTKNKTETRTKKSKLSFRGEKKGELD
jgi:hypothetical protein